MIKAGKAMRSDKKLLEHAINFHYFTNTEFLKPIFYVKVTSFGARAYNVEIALHYFQNDEISFYCIIAN